MSFKKGLVPSQSKGFTLIELMVVIAIIGILASIISVSLISSKAKGRDAKRIADIKTIQLALETYYSDNASYPTSIYAAPFYPNYLSNVPMDPQGGSWGNSGHYFYSSYNALSNTNCVSNPAIKYHLAAEMESSDQQGAPLPYNQALTQDTDWSTAGSACTAGSYGVVNFHGNALNCSGTSANTYDNCYDVTN